MDTCERFHALLVSEAERIGAERGVRFEFDAMLRTQPAALNQMLSERIAHPRSFAAFRLRTLLRAQVTIRPYSVTLAFPPP